MDVVLVRWPSERARREELVASRVPRLLLVDQGEPPASDDCLEDWIRMPSSDADLRARIDGVLARIDRHAHGVPRLDEDGVLRVLDRWVPLPPMEARLMALLLERRGTVVSRDALARAGWPGGAPGRNALDVHVLRVRRRIEGLGLAIRTVRSRGYLLESDR
jgi:DNA-binding response OmpR family regulator